MADTVLQTQELCDYITDFLHSSADLKSCALVSPQFTASAQRHLFHDIILNPGCSRIDGYGIRRSFDEAGACRRLCLVLKGSPHLTRLVRRLRASLEDEVIKQLATVKFSNLEELFLNRRRGGVSKSSVLLSAAEIIGLPSIRHVGLLFLIFRDMHDLARLFEKCTDQLQALYLDNTSVLPYFDTPDPLAFAQRAKIKRLHFAGDRTRKYWAWLLHPLCSFDLTELHDVDGGGMNVFSPASALLELSCSTIERLVIGTGEWRSFESYGIPCAQDAYAPSRAYPPHP
ncbi:hypothetical protein C8R44DRAFT_261761 [Mycena epipterygia]|nr:hypothetical protein C8R44DRAFT_261761 [Mycena epipterygia]